MADDLDFSLRHGSKTAITSPDPSKVHQNGHMSHSSAHNGHNVDEKDDLDTPLSAMQSAAVKTALIVNKRPILHDYVSIEEELEDECFSRHWIFRRKVGFDAGASCEDRTADETVTRRQPVTSSDAFMDPKSADFSIDPSKLREEKEQLLRQLESIQEKRRQLLQTQTHVSEYISEWDYRLASSQQYYKTASSISDSVKSQTRHIQIKYALAQRWHVLGDAFLIWHKGPFATINGIRLGRSAKTAFSSQRTESNNNNKPAASLFSRGDANNTQQVASTVIVPFHEINSALGQVVFLLYTLQNTPNSGISFRKHILQPCGHASKIGFLKNAKVSTSQHSKQNHALQQQHTHYGERRRIFATHDEVTWYNLHHYEENGSYLSMGYYSRKNFNTALEGLVHCIAEACLAIEKKDMALSVPYCIAVGGLVAGKDKERSDDAVVGGLPVQYDPDEGERWTMVWRYLLTDLKWLIAYAAKHVDR